LAAQRDLESVQRLWASPVLIAMFDIPWAPMFFAAIFVFDPMLGWLSVAGGAILIVVTVMNQAMTKAPLQKASAFTQRGEQLSDGIKQEAEVVQALGMTNAAFDRWQVARRLGLEESIVAADFGAEQRNGGGGHDHGLYPFGPRLAAD
jgi:ATP-binding cassette subfamily C protein